MYKFAIFVIQTIRTEMKLPDRLLVSALLAFLPLLQMLAIPHSRAYIVLTDKTGRQDTLYVGDKGSQAYEAPISVVFDAGMSDVEPGTSVFYEWRVERSYTEGDVPVQEQYLVRQEGHTEYLIEDDGSFTVSFAYSYRTSDSGDIVEGDELEPISFSIDVSDMYVPNAFSPNDDGKNDLFKVRVKSIVSFKMQIFNRWGQQMTSGDENTLQYETGNDNNGYFICWDGYHNGSVVPDGVYFIHIEAEGAGGKHYSRKSDINVLKGLGMEGGYR